MYNKLMKIKLSAIQKCSCVFLLVILVSIANSQKTKVLEPKFCNIILADVDENDCFEGICRFVDAAKARGIYEKMSLSLLIHSYRAQQNKPNEQNFYKQLYEDGNEIGVIVGQDSNILAKWLSIPAEKIITSGFDLFGDANVETQATQTVQGIRSGINVCVGGNSLAEFWDIPHNWEGAPMSPYWVQWDEKNPLRTDRTNREMEKDQAMLELHWASRTLWHNYDRYPIPQCWHFGEPLKHTQWSVGQLVRRGEKGGWWRKELEEYEKNLRADRTPFLYLNTASEANIFSPAGPWKTFLDSDEALECAIDLCELLLKKGWQLTTVSEFVNWYSRKWPCPDSPSMVYLMDDTLNGRKDRDGQIITGNGKLLHAETKYFQITDHENRIAPEMIVAYDLMTPNLLRGGYTFANPDKWNTKESKAGHYASTTGNALFWSPSEPLKSVSGEYYFIPYKSEDCRNRTFTFYLGDDWKPYQFAQGKFSDVRREGNKIYWTKEMVSPVAGKDINVRYHHVLEGPKHAIRIEVLGEDAEMLQARFRVSPYFHQGWDHAPQEPLNDSNVPDPMIVGQERNVFARIGPKEFAFSENNKELRTQTYNIEQQNDAGSTNFSIYNKNPGISPTCDDNPAFNRGVTLEVNDPNAKVKCIDLPGANLYVTAEIELGKHTADRIYQFTFRYWKGQLQ